MTKMTLSSLIRQARQSPPLNALSACLRARDFIQLRLGASILIAQWECSNRKRKNKPYGGYPVDAISVLGPNMFSL